MGDGELTYDPRIFMCRTPEEARAVILNGGDGGLTTNERWERETAFLSELINWLPNTRLVIDYGCGIGRMMRVMPVPCLGVDISPSMRGQGEAYLMQDNRHDVGFVSPGCLDILLERGLRAQGALAVWALQHVLDPDYCIRQIFNAITPGSPFYVVNQDRRWVPAARDGHFQWIDDTIDIWERIEDGGFVLVHEEPMPDTLVNRGSSWFRKYERAHV
jgi:hypothetical protein